MCNHFLPSPPTLQGITIYIRALSSPPLLQLSSAFSATHLSAALEVEQVCTDISALQEAAQTFQREEVRERVKQYSVVGHGTRKLEMKVEVEKELRRKIGLLQRSRGALLERLELLRADEAVCVSCADMFA